jgi:hypothetical protein
MNKIEEMKELKNECETRLDQLGCLLNIQSIRHYIRELEESQATQQQVEAEPEPRRFSSEAEPFEFEMKVTTNHRNGMPFEAVDKRFRCVEIVEQSKEPTE